MVLLVSLTIPPLQQVNQTGKSFNWGLIINNVSGYNFVTGTVINSLGNIEVVSTLS